MRVQIDVRIDSTDNPGSGGYGNVAFSEIVNLANSDFETVSKVFTRCHELLEVLKAQHAAKQEPRR